MPRDSLTCGMRELHHRYLLVSASTVAALAAMRRKAQGQMLAKAFRATFAGWRPHRG